VWTRLQNKQGTWCAVHNRFLGAVIYFAPRFTRRGPKDGQRGICLQKALSQWPASVGMRDMRVWLSVALLREEETPYTTPE
jgi:hypothetical protein